jgi:hypothetical protein
LLDKNDEPESDTVRFGSQAFIYYMANRQLHIDVWDGSSLMHIGVGCLDLAAALRRGRKGIEVEYDLDITSSQVTTAYFRFLLALLISLRAAQVLSEKMRILK